MYRSSGTRNGRRQVNSLEDVKHQGINRLSASRQPYDDDDDDDDGGGGFTISVTFQIEKYFLVPSECY
jgi:hypothetical protein